MVKKIKNSKIESITNRLFLLLVFLLPLQLGRHFWPSWSYVWGLRIDYLAPTIYLTDLLVIAILGLWGVEKISNFQFKIENWWRGYWWIFAFFIYLLVSSFFAQNSGVAFYKLIKIIELALLGLYVAKNHSSLFTMPASRHSFEKHPSLVLAVVYSSLIAIAQFLKQGSLNGVFWYLGERTFNASTPGIAKAIVGGRLVMRPYATFPHPNVLAGFILVSLILISSSNILKWLAIILGTGTVVISFSRSVWLVGSAIGLLVLLKHLWDSERIVKRHLRWWSASWRRCLRGGGVLLMLIILFGIFCFASRLSTNQAISQRLQLIKATGLMIKTAPLAGVGLNNFIVHLSELGQTSEAIRFLQPVHNLFLLVAAETGLIGLAIFLWFLMLTYKKLLITNNQLLIVALSAILALGFFDHYWFTLQQTQLLFAIVLGLSWRDLTRRR